RRHRLLGVRARCGTGDDGPRLRDRVDLALLARRRAERRAVVVVGTAIPGAVPAGAFERLPQLRTMRGIAAGAKPVAPRRAERRERRQNVAEKPAHPHALAATLAADAVHPVVPVAGAHER